MFWESHNNSHESLTIQFLQFIDWKTKDPPPPYFADDILSVVGTVDIVGCHLFCHILREYYFTECNVLTIELELTDLANQQQIDNVHANPREQRNKIITESVLIVTKLCSVICKMPNLKSLHLSLTNFPNQCYHPCVQMFNLGIQSNDADESKMDYNVHPNGNGTESHLFSGGNDVFPALEQLFLSPSIFYMNEENDDFIVSTPITDYNTTTGMVTSGYWSDDEVETEHKSNRNNLDIQQLMNEYDIPNRQQIEPQIGSNSLSPIDSSSIDGNTPLTWKCTICTLINRVEFVNCNACGEPRQICPKIGTLGTTPRNEPVFGDPAEDDNEEDIDDEKLLTIEEDEKSIYFPFLSFLSNHNRLKSVSINIAKRGKNGISLMNRILLSMAKREQSLDSLYIDCGSLHLHYSVRYLSMVIKRSDFKRFSCTFNTMDERSVSRVIEAFNSNPHRNLSFFSIQNGLSGLRDKSNYTSEYGVQRAGESVDGLVRFVRSHNELEYLKLNYFSGISRVGNGWNDLMQSLLRLQTLSFLSFGELLTDDNHRMNSLCQFVGQCTTLQTIDLSISEKSWEGLGGALENVKKCVFYAFKNQVFLQRQIEESSGILEVDYKMPLPIVELVVTFAFDIFGRFNININGLPEADMVEVGNQFMKLKQMKAKTWTTSRDLQLFTHL